MQISVSKSQKTSGGLGDLHVDDWENRRKIGIGTLYVISRHLQGSNWGLAELKKRSQYNESSFCSPARPQDSKDQR